MIKSFVVAWLLSVVTAGYGSESSAPPLRVGIIGLVHGHVAGFLTGGALTPAGGALNRQDVQVVGVVEPDKALYDSYAARFHWSSSMHFGSIAELATRGHAQAALIFTSTEGHTQAVEECARAGLHVMMEKPMAGSYDDALAMAEAARRGNIHVLVDYETTWYASNAAAHDLLAQGALGPMVKAVFRDGHSGPKQIHVQPEFFAWLTDPKLNGAGALYDFGCYGADLMTWLKDGETPISVTAVTKQLQPDVYPRVDDEADVMLSYRDSLAILEGSWNWPFNVKEATVYGKTGSVIAINSTRIEVRRAGEREGHITEGAHLQAPYDDPLHYLAAVIRGEVQEGNSLSSLKVNLTVSEILDAARRSARSGATVKLPLER